MVNTLQKRSSSDLLFVPSLNDENIPPAKSPSRTQKEKLTRSNSAERKYKLIKKKASKEKEHLIKGNVFETCNTNSNSKNTSTTVGECPKITAPKLKSKTNSVWKNSKLFDAILDDDFTLTRKLIIVEESDVNEICPEGNSVLHIAAAAGHIDCLELLIECGAKVNAQDYNNRTPLEYAVMYGNFDCASLLIENGADANVIKNGLFI